MNGQLEFELAREPRRLMNATTLALLDAQVHRRTNIAIIGALGQHNLRPHDRMAQPQGALAHSLSWLLEGALGQGSRTQTGKHGAAQKRAVVKWRCLQARLGPHVYGAACWRARQKEFHVAATMAQPEGALRSEVDAWSRIDDYDSLTVMAGLHAQQAAATVQIRNYGVAQAAW